jgi:DNA-binding CsgD family transcriptional regulator
LQLKEHLLERSKGVKESGRGRNRRVDATLSLFDPKLQKRLLELHSAIDLEAFFKSAVRLLQAVIPCDIVFSLVHDATGGGCSTAVWDSNCNVLRREYNRPSLVGDRHLSILAVNPGPRVCHLRDGSRSEEKTEGFPFFVPSVQGIAMRHAVALFLWKDTLDIVDLLLAPHRGPQMPDISATEMTTVQALYPHIDTAYRRLSRLQSATCIRRGLEDFVSMLPLPTILLDWQLAPLYHNGAARRAAALWSGTDPQLKLTSREFKTPPDLLAVLEQMQITNAASSVTFRERIVVHPRVPGLQVHLSVRDLRSAHHEKPSFIIRFETNGLSQDGKLATLTRLSPRERELALMVSEGKSNQEIADALGRRLNTVKSELHSVFTKLEIPSRARLMALLR